MITLFVFLGCFFGLAIFFRVPVGFSLGIGALAAFLYADLPLLNASSSTFSALDSIPYLAIPFFILAGYLMEFSGISGSLINLIEVLLGKVKGALGLVTIFACAAFGVLTGSALATISAIGSIVTPRMSESGYRRSYIGALLAATCFLGILIPPSVPGILYALSSGTSVTKVWLSTVGPAFVFMLGYGIINYWRAGKFTAVNKEKVPAAVFMKQFGFSLYRAVPALLMPIIIFGGIYGGICTATEAGALSAVYGIGYYLIYKFAVKGNVTNNLYGIFLTSAATTAVIGLLMIFANVGSRAITLSGVSDLVGTWIVDNIHSAGAFLLVVNVIYLIMGTFLDINCALLLMTPLLLPAAKAFGIDPVHFGAITLVNLSVGFMTPPFANGIFMACKITKADFVDIVKDIWPFIAVGLIVIVITTYMPGISMYIVNFTS